MAFESLSKVPGSATVCPVVHLRCGVLMASVLDTPQRADGAL